MKETKNNAEQLTDQVEKDSFSTKVGEFLGAVLCTSVVAAVVALITKFIFWLF